MQYSNTYVCMAYCFNWSYTNLNKSAGHKCILVVTVGFCDIGV